MFDIEEFVADCRAALERDQSSAAVREVVARAVSKPAALIKALGEPARGQIQPVHHSPELTILNVIWAPKMTIFPHNHDMWAVIGIYSGREDNVFWRRLPDNSRRVEATSRRLQHVEFIGPPRWLIDVGEFVQIENRKTELGEQVLTGLFQTSRWA